MPSIGSHHGINVSSGDRRTAAVFQNRIENITAPPLLEIIVSPRRKVVDLETVLYPITDGSKTTSDVVSLQKQRVIEIQHYTQPPERLFLHRGWKPVE